MRYENIAATELTWVNDPSMVRAFFLETFLNKRDRLRPRTAHLWKVLVDQYLAKDATHRPSHAEIGYNFGYDKNTIKVNLRRLRRQAEEFFANGGKYTPRQKKQRPPNPYEPQTYDLDVPLYKGLKQWRQPSYKMRQKGPIISSTVQSVIVNDDTVQRFESNILDSFAYDHERFKGWVSRLPMPEDIHTAESRAFLKAYEFDLYCQTKIQKRLAEKASEEYKRKCTGKNSPKDLERRALFLFDDDMATRRASLKEEASDNTNADHPRALRIKVNLGRRWTIEHSRYGRGEILKVNGNTVCCKFIEAGRVNLPVATIQRKTGVNLKKEARLKEALRIVRQCHFPVEQQSADNFSVPEIGSRTRNAADGSAVSFLASKAAAQTATELVV